MAMPDVFSIRHTTVEAYLEPIVHEVKVQRSDLLADLRRASKREAYLQLGGECWYVIKEGIAEPDEIPAECGVLVADASRPRRSPGRRRSGRRGSASRSGWRWRGRRRSKAGASTTRKARSATASGAPALAPATTPRLTRRCRAATVDGPTVDAAVARQDRRARQALWAALALIVVWGANFTRPEGDLHTPCRRAASCSSAT